MGLFIKTYNRGGDYSLVNVESVESMEVAKDKGIVYVPMRGVDQHASYYPSIAFCVDDDAKTIFNELIEFMANNTNGVYDAYSRVIELRDVRLANTH